MGRGSKSRVSGPLAWKTLYASVQAVIWCQKKHHDPRLGSIAACRAARRKQRCRRRHKVYHQKLTAKSNGYFLARPGIRCCFQSHKGNESFTSVRTCDLRYPTNVVRNRRTNCRSTQSWIYHERRYGSNVLVALRAGHPWPKKKVESATHS